MNTTLSTFLKIAITAVTIGFLLFGVAYTMTTGESNDYKGRIEGVYNKLPNGTSN